VFLRQGGVTCDVDRAVGGFAVRTAAGTASVTGTRFAVRVTGKEGEQMKMAVKVFIGSVLLSGAWGEVSLVAGEDVVLAAPAAAVKPAALGKIEAGKPTYEPRSGEHWRERGRIVGHLRNAPA
jgi:ferric-dicitrate binding protein FerR (iron transport regulator)